MGPDGVVQRVRLAAYAWCEADNVVLLVRIAPGYPGEGRWALPGGGLDDTLPLVDTAIWAREIVGR